MNSELETELINLIKNLQKDPTPKGRATVMDFLNSSFGVTAVGGVVVAIITCLITFLASHLAQVRDIRLATHSQQQLFMQDFGTRTERYMDLTVGPRMRQIWLEQHQHDSQEDRAKLRFFDGRTFSETRDFWEAERKAFLDANMSSASGLIYGAKLMFHNQETTQSLRELFALVTQYEETEDAKEVQAKYNAVLKELGETIESMANELNQNDK